MTADQQLSFDIVPATVETFQGTAPAEVLASVLAIKGDLDLTGQLQHGDELIITVTGHDGEVLSRHDATVSAPPAFIPIEDKDLGLVGYTRSHKAKVGDRT